MQTRTPNSINGEVSRLLEQLPRHGQPVFLDIETVPGAVPLECFANVDAQIARDGGEVQYGWAIWEWPAVLIEAEFHAVWKNPDGHLVDITPQIGGRDRVLFVPDPFTKFEGVPIDNIRIPLSDDPSVVRFIHDNEKLAKLKAKYFRNGVAEIPYHELVGAGLVGSKVTGKVGRNEPCPCGSGKKHKKCCLGN